MIHEGTAVSEIRPHEAMTAAGPVRARWVVRATEGYTVSLAGLRRALVPMNSSMIITEPLAPEVWEQIGWRGREVLAMRRTCMRICSERTTGGSRSGAAAFPTGTARHGRRGRDRAGDRRAAASAAVRDVPSRWGRRDRPCVVRGAGRSPRLVRVVNADPRAASPGRGATWAKAWRRWTRRPHAARAHPRPGERADHAAVGRALPCALGAGAAAMGIGSWRLRALPPGRSAGAPHRAPVIARPPG